MDPKRIPEERGGADVLDEDRAGLIRMDPKRIPEGGQTRSRCTPSV